MTPDQKIGYALVAACMMIAAAAMITVSVIGWAFTELCEGIIDILETIK